MGGLSKIISYDIFKYLTDLRYLNKIPKLMVITSKLKRFLNYLKNYLKQNKEEKS